MINSTARRALLGTASTAIALCLLPASASAQSTTCSQAGTIITCSDGSTTVLTGTASAGTATIPGPGLVTTSVAAPSTIVYSGPGPIATTGLRAVNLTSTGGALSFTPTGTSAPLAISTTGGFGADGLVINTPGQAATVTVGDIRTTGANSAGVLATGGTDLTLRTGNITTTGSNSTAVSAIAQTGSIDLNAGNLSTSGRGIASAAGAGGTNTIVVGNIVSGDRGILANGGTVNITTGDITTSTNGGTRPGGYGVVGQALAGGTGGVTIRTGAVTAVNGAGVGGTVFNQVGAVDIGGCSSVSNTGSNAAVFAQSNGSGALTINCGAISSDGNNAVFARSFAPVDGSDITINTLSASSVNTGFSTIFAQTAGTGTITVNGGVVTSTGAGAAGIDLVGGTGAIDAGYGNVTTTGAAANALRVGSTGNVNLRGSGATLRTNGANATAAVITGAGVTGNLGNVITTGAGSQGAVINSTAPVNLIVGNVATTGNALTINAAANAVTLATGTVTASEAGATGTVINTSGAINFNGGRQTTNGADALQINGGAGAINASLAGATTTGADADGVQINGSGPLTFANTGSIVTSGAGSRGIAVSGVTTAAVNCGSVSTTGASTPAVVIAANGTTNVTCGTVSTTGVASDAILVTNLAGSTTVTGGTTLATGTGSRGIVVASSAPAAAGLVTVNTGAVTANGNAVTANSGAANILVNASGNVTSTAGTGITAATAGATVVTINAGTTTTGVQGVSLQGAAGNTLVVNGTLRNTGGTTPYTVVPGGPFTLTLGSTGTIAGPLTFTTGNDTFNSQGSFALPATLDFQAGSDAFNNSGTVTAFTGASTLSNLESFNNAGGLIDMRDGAANDVVTLTHSNMVASGNARLGVDLVTSGGSNVADRLVIGGTTSGTTTLLVNYGNPVIDTNGALVVDSTLNNLTAGRFVLAGTNSFGLIDYAAQVRGGDVYLVSTPNARVYDTILLGRQSRDLWYKSADAYNAYATIRRGDFGQARSSPIGVWGQLYGESQKAGRNDRTATAFGTALSVSDRIRTQYRGAQVGIDFGARNFVIGATGGYERARSDSDGATDLRTEGHNYGLYAQFGMDSGLYAGALVKRDDYRSSMANASFQGGLARPDARSTGVEGEAGFRTGGEGKLNFDLGAGLAYVRTNIDAFDFGNISFDSDRMTSLRGRAHARATFAGSLEPFIEARGFHEFRGNTRFELQSGSASSRLEGAAKGSWVRLEGGIGGGVGPGGALLSAWVDLGDTKGYGARVGFRF